MRLAVSSRYPALCASSFDRRFRIMLLDVMQTTISSETKVTRHYRERRAGAYGAVAGHCSVIEAQKDGRLHSHSLIYGSSCTPQLLTRVACHPGLRERTRAWLDSICRAHLQTCTHEWLQSSQDDTNKLPRAFEIELPVAPASLEAFWTAAERRAATTNIHTHSFTCYKGVRGKYMCRLARPAGVHNVLTQPLILTRQKGGNLSKGIRPEVSGDPIDDESCVMIDGGYDIDKGELFPKRLRGPLAWELHRPSSDASVVETNLVLAALTASHTNSSIINGEASGDSVEQYQQAYMTKDQAALSGAVPMVLGAMKYVSSHTSKAEDRDTDVRKGMYLATRTVNACNGAHEWSHTVMVFALNGYRSIVTSDSFWYIFPWALVKWMKTSRNQNEPIDEESTPMEESGGDEERPQDSVETQLNEIIAMTNNDVDGSLSVKGSASGARSFRVDSRVVFVSQVDSYLHRGEHFETFSPLEFECIVDVLPTKPVEEFVKNGVGRPKRSSFPFASTHPLYGHYEGYIRMKMHTAVFGGRPPPRWKEEKDKGEISQGERRALAQYVLCTFTPWNDAGEPAFSWNEDGMRALFKAWDNSKAPLVHRQRYRYIRNVLQAGRRSSVFESILTDWRNRGVDLWKEATLSRASHRDQMGTCYSDHELSGRLPSSCNVPVLLEEITRCDDGKRNTFRAMQEALRIPFAGETSGTSDIELHEGGPTHHGVQRTMYGGRLQMLASRLRVIRNEPAGHVEKPCGTAISEPENAETEIDTSGLSVEQGAVVRHVVSALEHQMLVQTLTMLHGPGGTGKSFVVRRIVKEIEKRGHKVVATCPTGAGACQLDQGQTFHSAFKCLRKNQLSSHSMELLRATFDDRVVLIVVDEVSMFGADLLYLLDRRLKTIYRTSDAFGGRSILLVGDFSQLRVVSGITLCKLMYASALSAEREFSKLSFQAFKVMFLTQQERARGCDRQQQLLNAMRVVPVTYPASNEWRFVKDSSYYPLTSEVMSVITSPLKRSDVDDDPAWLHSSVVIVTGNEDRAAMNAVMARLLSERSGVLLFRWRKRLSEEVEAELGESLDRFYDEEERPTLFGYFFKGATGQILDNANGNVSLGIANGTLCRYHSLGWDDNTKTSMVVDLVESCLRQNERVVELAFPPDFINVTLLQRNGEPIPAQHWQQGGYLENDEELVVVPVGIITSKAEEFYVRIAGRKDLKVGYQQHAVDMAMATTVWKAQGATFERVILLLEGSMRSPRWEFEHLYVALSRVRSVHHIRCVPLSFLFKRHRLLKLRPNIYTVRWRMDLDKNGFWKDRLKAA